MQVGCVLTAGASQLRYVWHGLFDSILKHSSVSLSLSLDSFSVSLCEKLNVRWNGAETSSLKSEELFHTNIFSVVFFLFLTPLFKLLSTSSIITSPPPSLPPPLSHSPLSPGDWVNSTEWQDSPAAVDGWVDPLRWDQCPGGGGEGGYGEHWPPLTGWPRGPGCWPPSCCPYWPSVWRGRPSLPPRRRRPLWNLKVSSRGWEGEEKKSLGGGARGKTICLFCL